MKIRINLPWPLATVVTLSEEDSDLTEFTMSVRAGSFGDHPEWLAAEERWKDVGIDEADLALCTAGKFFDASVVEAGVPWAGLSVTHRETKLPVDWVDQLIDIAISARGRPRHWLLDKVQFVLMMYSPNEKIATSTAHALLNVGQDRCGNAHIYPDIISSFTVEQLALPTILDRLATLGSEDLFYARGEYSWGQMHLKALECALDERPELLVLLAIMILIDDREKNLTPIPIEKIRSLLSHPSRLIQNVAGVMLLLAETGDEATVRNILRTASSQTAMTPLALLRLCLDHRWLSGNAKMRICDLIANVANADPAIFDQTLLPRIQTIATTRVSALQDPQIWSNLALGGALLGLLQSRRETHASKIANDTKSAV